VEPLVELDGIGASLGGQPVLRGVDLALIPGETLGIAGPNGSGKTTLLRLLATLVVPDRGRGRILGEEFGTPRFHRVRSSIGLIGHGPALIPELTLSENLLHAAKLGAFEAERIGSALNVVGLRQAADRRVDASSYGMRRRAEFAMALLRRPRLLLLDEPLSGLDEAAVGLVKATVEATTERGGSVVMVSHEPSHLEGCTRKLRLERGNLTEGE
jgi:heme ABC exporter ATP-binding subunit CcmA